MNSYDFFIYEFICFMNSYMNSGVSRFQMYIILFALHQFSSSNLHYKLESMKGQSDLPLDKTRFLLTAHRE